MVQPQIYFLSIYHSVVNKLQFTYYKCSIAIQFLKRIANPKFFDKYIWY